MCFRITGGNYIFLNYHLMSSNLSNLSEASFSNIVCFGQYFGIQVLRAIIKVEIRGYMVCYIVCFKNISGVNPIF